MEGRCGGGGGEVRRIHIIYFLSRMGRAEQPHLIRVHHLSRNGVHLRDVKRWLSDLRGKDMPNSFSWAYKRSYKRGYVWQDLTDDDLITPVSDNEYVLKGSAIFLLVGEKPGPKLDQPQQPALIKDRTENPEASSSFSSTKTSCTEVKEDDSRSFDSEMLTSMTGHRRIEPNIEVKESNEESTKDVGNAKLLRKLSSLSASPFNESKSRSTSKNTSTKGSASRVFRNLLNCGVAETIDSAMKIINKNKMMNPPVSPTPSYSADVIPGSRGVLGGSENIFNGAWDGSKQGSSTRKPFGGEKKPSYVARRRNVAYKPVGKPNCSQCGKTFKPEKLCTHMRYCRGTEVLTKDYYVPNTKVDAAAEKKTSHFSSNTSSYGVKTRYILT